MRARVLSIVISGVAAFAAIAQQPEAVKPAPVEQKVEAPAAPEITLVEAGAEPRRELRMTPRADVTETCTMRMKMSMTMKMGEQEMPAQDMPAMVMVMGMKVGSVSPEGDISYDLSVSDCRVEAGAGGNEMMVQAMSEALLPLKRLTGTGVVTSRGINKAVKLKFPEDMPEAAAAAMGGLTDQMGQIGSPLPVEAVGVGAKWRVKTKVKSQGLSIDQTATYTLKEIGDGGLLKLDVVMEQGAAPQKVNSPGIPPGIDVELKSLASTGNGSSEFVLTSIVPRKVEMKTSTDLAMKVSQGTEVSDMKQSVKVEMTMTGGEAKPAAEGAKETAKD